MWYIAFKNVINISGHCSISRNKLFVIKNWAKLFTISIVLESLSEIDVDFN